MEYPSLLVENVVEALSHLPGVGKRSALRYALYLLKQPPQKSQILANAILDMRLNIKYCKKCHCISDNDICSICSQTKRNHKQVLVVEDLKDVMAIENTSEYNGVYHILQGIISPINGVFIGDLTIDHLIERIVDEGIEEIIFGIPTTADGEITSHYINNRILEKKPNIIITQISHGVPIGDNLEFADQTTIARSIKNRIPFKDLTKQNDK
ncbi:MAG: recombination mediator RecR [Bacteroidales bacterium]|nr:recombination mediator RecR [Bacteroidales bacterium]